MKITSYYFLLLTTILSAPVACTKGTDTQTGEKSGGIIKLFNPGPRPLNEVSLLDTSDPRIPVAARDTFLGKDENLAIRKFSLYKDEYSTICPKYGCKAWRYGESFYNVWYWSVNVASWQGKVYHFSKQWGFQPGVVPQTSTVRELIENSLPEPTYLTNVKSQNFGGRLSAESQYAIWEFKDGYLTIQGYNPRFNPRGPVPFFEDFVLQQWTVTRCDQIPFRENIGLCTVKAELKRHDNTLSPPKT